jgi:hypothetical protein
MIQAVPYSLPIELLFLYDCSSSTRIVGERSLLPYELRVLRIYRKQGRILQFWYGNSLAILPIWNVRTSVRPSSVMIVTTRGARSDKLFGDRWKQQEGSQASVVVSSAHCRAYLMLPNHAEE